jgi:hypothetical protein
MAQSAGPGAGSAQPTRPSSGSFCYSWTRSRLCACCRAIPNIQVRTLERPAYEGAERHTASRVSLQELLGHHPITRVLLQEGEQPFRVPPVERRQGSRVAASDAPDHREISF